MERNEIGYSTFGFPISREFTYQQWSTRRQTNGPPECGCRRQCGRLTTETRSSRRIDDGKKS